MTEIGIFLFGAAIAAVVTWLVMRTQMARVETQLESERANAEEKLELLRQAREQLKLEFQQVANQIFEDKGKKFDDNAEKVLKPFKEQLEGFRKKVEEVQRDDATQRASLQSALQTEIKNLKELHVSISDEARNLTRALKGDSKVRGNWGEMILERVLEASGLTQGREYVREHVLQDDDGSRYRPDAIIRLPEQKDVIVDAKVSLVAYERYVSAEHDDVRAVALKEHLAAVRLHMKQLAERRYDQLPGVRSLDFVMMFVPVEPALILAWEHDPALFSDAFENRVFLVNPSTLFAVLRVVQNLWKYDAQNKNAEEIARRGGELYDKFSNFVKTLDGVGAAIDKAGEQFKSARDLLATGRGNVIRQVQMLKELGVKANKQLPPDLVERAELSDAVDVDPNA